MSDFYFIIQETMKFSIPLLIVALGGMFSERSGVVNIALEGIMILGAFTGVLFINFAQGNMALSGQSLLLAALIVSAATGVVVSLVHAYASINMKADQVISGTAINLFAPAFAIFTARQIQVNQKQQIPFRNDFFIQKVPGLSEIPVIGPMFFQNAYITTYLGFLVLAASWFVLMRTSLGLRLRACGEHPQAADSVGINVYTMRYIGVMISGALAGMGGLVFIIPTTTEFNASVAGYGFLALAVLIFGQWRPWLIMCAALFFGVLKAVSSAYSGISLLKGLPVPSYFYKALPFVVTLMVLVLTSKRSQAPKAAGVPYDIGKR